MTLRKILSGVGKFFKWFFITIALFIGLLLAVNAVDESPTKEAEAIVATPQIIEDPNNGFYAFVGAWKAPQNEQISNYGMQWVETYNSAVSKVELEKANSRFKGKALDFVGDKDQLCRPTKFLCLPLAKARAKVWRKYYIDNKVFVDRQRHLTDFSHFDDTYFPPQFYSPIPPFGNPFRDLVLSMIAVDAAEGRLVSALSTLESIIAFDRRALLGSRSLVLSMVMRHWLMQDYALLAEIVSSHNPALSTQKARLARMTEPLEIDQIRNVASRMFEGEARTMFRGLPISLNESNAWSDILMRPFFKQQATLNLAARNHEALQSRIQSFSPVAHDTWVTNYQQEGENQDDSVIHSWRVLYNPSGKLLISIGRADLSDYILRLSDLIGVTRLARLQVEVVTAGVTDANINTIILSNKALYDPYTDHPMGWEPDKRQLYFDLQGNVGVGASKRIQVGI